MEGEEGLFNVDGVDFDNFTLPVGLDEDKGGNWSDFYPPECVNLTDPSNCTLIDGYELYEPSVGIVVLLSICYGLISAGAVFGNSLVIYMVIKSRRMRTITNFFIANLALSDVIIGTFSIPFQFQAALLQRWNLPEVMCNLCPFFQNVSVNASILTLVAIAMDRYTAIIHPFSKKSSKQGTKIRIAFIWLFSVLLSIPQIIAFRVEIMDDGHNGHVPQCIPINVSMDFFVWYMFALCFVQYFVPLCLLLFAYTKIALNLWGRKAPGEAEERRDSIILKNKKKAIKVLMFVVGLFAVCWLPLQTYQVTSVLFSAINNFKYINIVWFCSHWLAMSNSCVNPFIYFFCHDKFKKEFQSQFKWCFGKMWPKSKLRGRKCDQYDVDGISTGNGTAATAVEHRIVGGNDGNGGHQVRYLISPGGVRAETTTTCTISTSTTTTTAEKRRRCSGCSDEDRLDVTRSSVESKEKGRKATLSVFYPADRDSGGGDEEAAAADQDINNCRNIIVTADVVLA